ncbi:Short chain dehydrogenase FGM9 [Cladobotryum mycophilum]|uniref:Short chain dehydrogenase FGM9 n=1 Tax=Cladobotryum mycophilum TaxID=491253 RepID=A0ABR0S9F6_9HYPO
MSLLSLLRAQYKHLPIPLSPDDVAGRTYIVTGANSGLGLECTKHLVRLGAARVIMAVRNVQSGEEAKAAIEGETGRCAEGGGELDRIDGLIENAAIANNTWLELEGNASDYTVNVLSTILLAALMLPHMEKSAQKFDILPRIAIIGSGAAFQARAVLDKLDINDIFGDLRNREKWEPQITSNYPLSKLLLHFAYLQLIRLAPVERTGVVINLVNPGICYSGLTRNANMTMWLQVNLARLLMGRTAEAGSRTLLHGLAVGKEGHGKYLSECEISEHLVPEWVTDDDGKKWQIRVWEQVSEILQKEQPGCLDGLSKSS